MLAPARPGPGGHRAKARDRRRDERLRRLGFAGQHVVDAGPTGPVDAEPDGRVGLRIDVDEQRLVARLGDAGGDVDGGRRLPDAALLVRDRVDAAHQVKTLAARGDGRRA